MSPRRGLLLVVLGALCWGSGGLAGALLGAEADLAAPSVAAYRLLGGGLAVLVGVAAIELVRPRGRLRVATRATVARVLTVALLVAAFQAAYFSGVFLVGVAVATLVTLGTAPVLVAGAQAVRRRRLPGARVLLALASAVVGLVLLVALGSRGGAGEAGRGSTMGPAPSVDAAVPGADLAVPGADLAVPGAVVGGIGLCLLAAVAFAALVVVNRRPVRGLEPLAMTGLSFTLGGVLLVPLALVSGGLGAPTSATGWGWLAFLALVPTAIAYACYFSGLPAAGPTPAALAALLEPVTAAVLAVIVLGERLGVAGWCGAGLLVAAVVLARPRTGPSPTMVLGPRAVRGRRPTPARAAVDEPWE